MATKYYYSFQWDSANYYFRRSLKEEHATKKERVNHLQNYIHVCFELGLEEEVPKLLHDVSTEITDKSSPENLRHLNQWSRLFFVEQEFRAMDSVLERVISLNLQRSRRDTIESIRSHYYRYHSKLVRGEKLNPRLLEGLLDILPQGSFFSQILEFEIFNSIFWVHFGNRNFKAAHDNIEKANRLLPGFLGNDIRRHATALKNKALVSIYIGNYAESIKNFRKVRSIYDTLKTSVAEEAEILNFYAIAWNNQRNFVRADESFQKSLRLYESLGPDKYSSQKIIILQNLINLYYNLPANGRTLDLVREFYEKAQTIISQNPTLSYFLPDLNFTLAMIYLKAEQETLAEKYLFDAKTSYESISSFQTDSSKQAILYQYLGDLYMLKKEFNSALANYKKAVNLTKELVDGYLRASAIQTRIAKLFRRTDRIDSALYYIQSSLVALKALNDEVELSNFEENPRNLDSISISIYLLDAIQVKNEILSDYSFKQSNRELLKLNLESSLLSNQVLDSIKEKLDHDLDRLNFFENRQSIFDIGVYASYNLFKDKNDPAYLENSFFFAEKSKSNNLLANAAELSRFESIKPGESEENELFFFKSKINYYESLIKSESDRVLLYSYQDSLYKYRVEHDKIVKIISNSYPAFSKLDIYEEITSFDSLRKELKPSETLIEYIRADSNLYAIALNKQEVVFKNLKISRDFDFQLNTFLKEFYTGQKQWDENSRKEFVKTSRYLFKVLLYPLLQSITPNPQKGKSKLIIIPDGNLGYVPFDMLLTEDVDDLYNYKEYPFLLNDYFIRMAYSATLMQKLKTRKQKNKQLLAAFAPTYLKPAVLSNATRSVRVDFCDVNGDKEFRELTQSKMELNGVLKSFDGQRFDSLAASEKNFKDNANGYSVLHLSMHAFTNNCDPMYSGLAFTPRRLLEEAGVYDTSNPTNEGILYAYEIYNMRINAELVVMSACQTGLGKIQTGEGVMSLARAFAHAGSPNTIMSLWKVQEGPTRELMTSFYHYLSEGKGKDEALQLAKLDYLANNADAHPFYWAGFTLIGDDKPIIEDNWFEKNWWMLAIGLALLLAIYAVLRKYSSSARTQKGVF